jgi:hypothetical protein
MIAASLAVIVLTVALLFSYQKKADEAHIREQGVSLARVLSRMPFAQLLPAAGQQGVLSLLQYGQADPAFAFLLIVDPHGTALNEVSSPGVIAPGVPLSANPTSWLDERTLRLSSDGRAVQEFHAPLFDQGQLAGYLRLEYFKPGFGLDADQVPYVVRVLKLLGIVYRVIATHLAKKAGLTRKTARTGAVTLIQSFRSALHLNIHFHMLFLDGVYVDRPDGSARFRWVKAPTSAELTQLLHTIARRVGRFLERQDLLERDAENSYLAGDTLDEYPLNQLLGHSITYRIAVGPQAGRKVFA